MTLSTDGKGQASRGLAYEQVGRRVLEMIRDEGLEAGERLPSERELASRFHVNHQTVRKALEPLVEQQIIERRVGAGTFVKNAKGSLRGGAFSRHAAKNTTVGVIVSPEMDMFATEMLKHLHWAADSQGYKLLVSTVSRTGRSLTDAVSDLVDQRCLAILLPRVEDAGPVEELRALIDSTDIPVVLGRNVPGLEANCHERAEVFGWFDFQAIHLACRYMERIGYTHLAMFAPDQSGDDTLMRRMLGYSRYISGADVTAHFGLVGEDTKGIERFVQQLKGLAGDVGVICYDDDFAIRLLLSLHKNGVRVPEDVAVIGINNISLGAVSDPPLTTIEFAYDYVAKSMLDHGIRMTKGDFTQGEGESPLRLIVRESCGGTQRFGDQLGRIVKDVQAQIIEVNSMVMPQATP